MTLPGRVVATKASSMLRGLRQSWQHSRSARLGAPQ
jgi:hypothetical protein